MIFSPLRLPVSPTRHEDAKLKMQWLLRLRWLAIALLVVLAPAAVVTGFLDAQSLVFYVGILALFLMFNILTQAMWWRPEQTVSKVFLAFQLTIDLVVLTGLLLLTGGITNPFYVIIFANVLLGAFLLEGFHSFIFLVLCHQALLLLQLITPKNEPHFQIELFKADLPGFMIQHLALLSIWFISRSLGRTMSAQQERLLQVQLQVEKMGRLRALGALTAGFSHEFASPLNALKLRLDRELKAQPESKNLQEMNLAVEECTQVIREMNNAQMDPREFQFQLFAVNEVLDEALQSWRQEHPQAAVVTQWQSSRPLRLPLLNLTQSFLNLLDNAFEANADGNIQVRLQEQAAHLHLIIEDQGPGFSADVLKRFGEPFLTTKNSGTGLGLYTSQLFMQSVGGHMKIDNQSSSGARVELVFPLPPEQEAL